MSAEIAIRGGSRTIASAGVVDKSGYQPQRVGELVRGIENVGIAVERLRIADRRAGGQGVDRCEAAVGGVVVSRLRVFEARFVVFLIAGVILPQFVRARVPESARPLGGERLVAERSEVLPLRDRSVLVRDVGKFNNSFAYGFNGSQSRKGR